RAYLILLKMVCFHFHFKGFFTNMLYFFTFIFVGSFCSYPNFYYRAILNSFSSTNTNGFTEGCNNKIKVLKRNAYGFRNFNRFRNRILHIFSLQSVNSQKQATA
ncbi:transposase, partial [Ruminococcus sp. YE282]|uniref:transposase n=1 Tax=Ruminococcus sp. YE282 TaxID=3158780 RepID=UPI00296EE3B4